MNRAAASDFAAAHNDQRRALAGDNSQVLLEADEGSFCAPGNQTSDANGRQFEGLTKARTHEKNPRQSGRPFLPSTSKPQVLKAFQSSKAQCPPLKIPRLRFLRFGLMCGNEAVSGWSGCAGGSGCEMLLDYFNSGC